MIWIKLQQIVSEKAMLLPVYDCSKWAERPSYTLLDSINKETDERMNTTFLIILIVQPQAT